MSSSRSTDSLKWLSSRRKSCKMQILLLPFIDQPLIISSSFFHSSQALWKYLFLDTSSPNNLNADSNWCSTPNGKTLVWIGIAAISKVLVEWPSLEYLLDVLLLYSSISNGIMSSIFINICSLSSSCMHFWCTSLLLCRCRCRWRGASICIRTRGAALQVACRTDHVTVCRRSATSTTCCPSCLPASCPSLLLFTSPPQIFLHFLVRSLLLTYSLCIQTNFSNDDYPFIRNVSKLTQMSQNSTESEKKCMDLCL